MAITSIPGVGSAASLEPGGGGVPGRGTGMLGTRNGTGPAAPGQCGSSGVCVLWSREFVIATAGSIFITETLTWILDIFLPTGWWCATGSLAPPGRVGTG